LSDLLEEDTCQPRPHFDRLPKKTGGISVKEVFKKKRPVGKPRDRWIGVWVMMRIIRRKFVLEAGDK
jgi:hypothetical protein